MWGNYGTDNPFGGAPPSRSENTNSLRTTGYLVETTSAYDSEADQYTGLVNGYSWKRKELQGNNASVANPSFQQWVGKNAFHPRGETDIPVGTLCWCAPDPSHTGYLLFPVPEFEAECVGCEWVASLRASTCLKVSVVSAEGDCDCGDTNATEVILSSSDGKTWKHSASNSGGGTGGGEGCCDGITLPDSGIFSAIRDETQPFNCDLSGQSNVPISLVEPGHWSTSGGFISGPDIHIQCADGAWAAWQDSDPINSGTLVSANCNLVNPPGGQTYALIDFYFSFTTPCTWAGHFVFRFETGQDPSTADRGGLLTRCGVDYSPTFTLGDFCDPGCLSLTSIGGIPCCGDEGSETVAATVVIGETTYTGNLAQGEGQSWSGTTSPPPPPPTTAECYQVDGGAIMTRDTPGVDVWSTGLTQLRGPTEQGVGNWQYSDVGVCMDVWTATGWDGTGCHTFGSGTCSPSTVEVCAASCP